MKCQRDEVERSRYRQYRTLTRQETTERLRNGDRLLIQGGYSLKAVFDNGDVAPAKIMNKLRKDGLIDWNSAGRVTYQPPSLPTPSDGLLRGLGIAIKPSPRCSAPCFDKTHNHF
jgi:hypothetical protein